MKTITIGTKWHEKVKNIRKSLIRTDLTCYCDTVVVILLHLQKKTESFYLFLEKKHLVEISRQGNLDWSLGQKKQTKNHQLIFLCVSFSLNICCCFSFCFFFIYTFSAVCYLHECTGARRVSLHEPKERLQSFLCILQDNQSVGEIHCRSEK